MPLSPSPHPLRISRSPGALVALALLLICTSASRALGAETPPAPAASAPNPPSAASAAIQQDLRRFRELGTVLYVAAHPDDENTEFISFFARGRAYRTAYLSVTRGDGGQNELGADFSEKLGVLRTQELLAARRIDGGRQFFTRAIDFGYSKTPEETLRFWDHDQVLADIVRVIRRFRPDVIVTRFPIPPGSGGHGHHTASAILAVEAFKLAGDPTAFPDQLTQGLVPWQPKRIFWNVFSWNRTPSPLPGPTLQVDIGGNDPITGEPFGRIANRSRGMHKTQGLGGLANRDASGPNVQSFQLLAGEPATTDLFDGVDCTWNRLPGAAGIGPLADDLLAKFDPQEPAASVPAILAIRAKLAALPTDPLLAEKRADLDRLLQACLGLEIEESVAEAGVVPGEKFKFRSSAVVHSDIPVQWVGSFARGLRGEKSGEFTLENFGSSAPPLTPDALQFHDNTALVVPDVPLTQPYWLREAASPGLSTVSDPRLIGSPENPPEFLVEEHFVVGGQTFSVSAPVAQIATKPDGTKTPRPLEVIAPVIIAWTHPLELLAPGATKTVTLELTATRADTHGTLQLDAPAGWKLSPATRDFQLAAVGEIARFDFDLTAPAQPSSTSIAVRAAVGPRRYHRGRVELRYDHLPVQLLQPDAPLHAVVLDVATRAKHIGYIPGAGDDVADALGHLGCTVTELATATDLAPESLRDFDAIVIGVRAFNENKLLAAALPALLAYVEAGGTVIAQYNRPSNALKDQPLGPYPLSIQGSAPQLRVTDETAPVAFLAPDHPALNSPNKITASDFDGWVQERGAYFASSWDEAHYTALLAMNDPGEAPLKSSLLIAPHGRGYFVYTGLSFFRQLPAGVPGAYRLFANLISLGK